MSQNLFIRFGRLTGTLMLVASLSVFQACNSKKESRTEEALKETGDAIAADTKDAVADAKADLKEAGEKADDKSAEASEDFKRERDEVVAKLNEAKDKLDVKIAELKAKAAKENDKAKAETERQEAKLEVERQQLSDDIDKAKHSTADAWQEVKTGFKKAGRDIGHAFDKAGDKLKKD